MINDKPVLRWESPEFKKYCREKLLALLKMKVTIKLVNRIGINTKSTKQLKLTPLVMPHTTKCTITASTYAQHYTMHNERYQGNELNKSQTRSIKLKLNKHKQLPIKLKQFNFTKIAPLSYLSLTNINRNLNKTIGDQNAKLSMTKHKTHILRKYPTKESNHNKTSLYNEDDSENDLQHSQILNEWKSRMYDNQL